MRGFLARAGLETVTALHDLDKRFSKGVPLRMRMLARKGSAAPALPADPAAALGPVLEALVALKARAALQAPTP
jgi:hypothetical protein